MTLRVSSIGRKITVWQRRTVTRVIFYMRIAVNCLELKQIVKEKLVLLSQLCQSV